MPDAAALVGEAPATDIAITTDAFYGGRLLLRQPARGHRAGTDAVLLAAAVPRDCNGLIADVGAGVGAAGLGAAFLAPGARVVLLENDPLAVRLAADNIAANVLAARARVVDLDILSAARRHEAELDGRADLVLTNPPFHEAGTVRASPDPARRAAHVEGAGGLAAWLAASLALLRPHGTLVVIHRADAVPALLRSLEGRASVTLLPVLPREGSDAVRVLLRAEKGGRAPFRLAPPLVLHAGAGFTPEAERLHRGQGGLRW